MSLYLNTYTLNKQISVWNVNNTTDDPKVRYCQFNIDAGCTTFDWYNLWKVAVGHNDSSCSAVGCDKAASVGAHISFKKAGPNILKGSNRIFICPLCSDCNNERGQLINIKNATQLIHLGLFMKDILPDENTLVEDYDNSPNLQNQIELKDYVATKTMEHINNQLEQAAQQENPHIDDQTFLLGPLEYANTNLIQYVS